MARSKSAPKRRGSTAVVDALRAEIDQEEIVSRYHAEPEAFQVLPKYKRLRPKEARLSIEQLLGLKRLVSHLGDERKARDLPKDEAITENTLIRIAVDYLLECWPPRLVGSNEQELREGFFKAQAKTPGGRK